MRITNKKGGKMEQLTKKELQKSQLGILKYIDRVCKENKIKYFIHYGSMLGAVRHQGFIPWDDDIDIGMYREDYETLRKIILEEQNERYGILDKDTSDWYFQNFMVVIDKNTVIKNHVTQKPHDTSVFVDVFPIDRFDDTKVIKKAHLLVTLRQICYIKKKYIQYADSKIKDFCRKTVWYLLRGVNPRYFTYKIDKLITKYSLPNGKYEAAIGVGKDGMKEVFPSGTFENLVEVPFEDMNVPIPEKYDLFLTQFYGNYMQKPSDEEIAYKSHLLKAYWKGN